MVTARGGPPRILREPWASTDVERSFGELLAAFGDLVVARTRGAPAEPPGGSIATLVRRYRSGVARSTGARRAHRARPGGGGGSSARSRTCAPPSPGSTSSSRRPGRSRPSAGSPVDEDPARPAPGQLSIAATGLRPAPSASAARRSTARRSWPASRTEPDAAARRRLFLALEPLWRTVDGDGGDGSPYRRLLRSSAARWAGARLPDRGQRRGARDVAGRVRGDAPRHPRRVAVDRRAGPARTVGLLATRLGPPHGRWIALVPADRLLDLERRATSRRSGRTWRRSGSATTSVRATAGR